MATNPGETNHLSSLKETKTVDSEIMTPLQRVMSSARDDILRHAKAFEIAGPEHEKWMTAFADAAANDAAAEYEAKKGQDVIVQISERLNAAAQTNDEKAVVSRIRECAEVGRGILVDAWNLEKIKAKRSQEGSFNPSQAMGKLYRTPGAKFVHVESDGRSIELPALFESVHVEEEENGKPVGRIIEITKDFRTRVMQALGILQEGEDIRAIGPLVLPRFTDMLLQKDPDFSLPFLNNSGGMNIATNLPTKVEGTTARYNFDSGTLNIILTDRAKMINLLEFPKS